MAHKTTYSMQDIDTKFVGKGFFNGIAIGDEEIVFRIFRKENTTDWGISVIRKTMLKTRDRSCRHIPVQFNNFNDLEFRLMYNETELPIDYYLYANTMVVVSNVPLDGKTNIYTSGKQIPYDNNQTGLKIYEVQHDLYET